VWFRGWRILGIQGLEEQRGIRGIRGADGLEGFFTSLHHFITLLLKKVQKPKFRVQSSKFF
jgi:hypothetical protein